MPDLDAPSPRPPRQRARKIDPTLEHHPWIRSSRRKLIGYWDNDDGKMRTVWQAATKLGTQPGGIGLFSAPPQVGLTCEWWHLTVHPADVRWRPAKRVHIDRIDDVIQRVFVSLV